MSAIRKLVGSARRARSWIATASDHGVDECEVAPEYEMVRWYAMRDEIDEALTALDREELVEELANVAAYSDARHGPDQDETPHDRRRRVARAVVEHLLGGDDA